MPTSRGARQLRGLAIAIGLSLPLAARGADPSPAPTETAEARGERIELGPLRLGLGPGLKDSSTFLLAFEIRIAGHALPDPSHGDLAYTELVLGAAEVHWEPEKSKVSLAHLTAASLKSYEAIQLPSHPISWQSSLGATTLHDAGCKGCLAGYAEGGGGASVAIDPSGHLALFGLGEIAIQGTPDLTGISGGPVRVGVGPLAGARAILFDRLTLVFQGCWWWLPGASPVQTWRYETTARIAVGIVALALEYRAFPLERLALAEAFVHF